VYTKPSRANYKLASVTWTSSPFRTKRIRDRITQQIRALLHSSPHPPSSPTLSPPCRRAHATFSKQDDDVLKRDGSSDPALRERGEPSLSAKLSRLTQTPPLTTLAHLSSHFQTLPTDQPNHKRKCPPSFAASYDANKSRPRSDPSSLEEHVRYCPLRLIARWPSCLSSKSRPPAIRRIFFPPSPPLRPAHPSPH
jgi:hypothetical protein